MVLVLRVGIQGEAWHHMCGNQVKPLVLLELLLCTAEQPRESAWLFCPLETAPTEVFVSILDLLAAELNIMGSHSIG
jgi:hypothetical protein